jgi:hypothetical protein
MSTITATKFSAASSARTLTLPLDAARNPLGRGRYEGDAAATGNASGFAVPPPRTIACAA